MRIFSIARIRLSLFPACSVEGGPVLHVFSWPFHTVASLRLDFHSDSGQGPGGFSFLRHLLTLFEGLVPLSG